MRRPGDPLAARLTAPPPAPPPSLPARIRSRVARAPDVRIYAALTLAFIALRVLAVLGAEPVLFPDSTTWRQDLRLPEYDFVSFTGGSMRGWLVPLFYMIWPTDESRVTAQVAISLVAWSVLAGVVAAALATRALRLIGYGMILALSCVPAIASWDLVILAESLANSLTALVFAGWIAFVRWPTRVTSSAAVALTILWMATKASLFADVALIAAVLLLVAAVRPRIRLVAGAAGAALAVVAAWGGATAFASDVAFAQYPVYSSGFTQTGMNMTARLRLEILATPDARRWFESQGMPPTPGLTPYARITPADDGFPGQGAFFREVQRNPALVRWLETSGRQAWLGYVVAFLPVKLAAFQLELPWMLAPPREAIVYTDAYQAVLPSGVESLLFETRDSARAPVTYGDTAFLAGALIVLCIVTRPRGHHAALMQLAIIATCIAIAGIGVAWLGSPVEHARHALPNSVLIRLGLMLGVLALLDSAVLDRARRAARTPTLP